jgi:hypothetical protein
MEVSRRGRLGLVAVVLCAPSCQEPLQDYPGAPPAPADEDPGEDDGDDHHDPPLGPCDGVPGADDDDLVGGMPGACELEDESAEPEPEPPPGPSLPLFVEGSTTFVALPDTQYYSLRYPSIFRNQTAWIAEHAVDRNIAYVFHLGDIVHTNSTAEWKQASAAMAELDGLVPYGLVPGNHDYGPYGNATTRDTQLNKWFSFDDTELMPSFGGAFQAGRLDNTYHLFDAGGHAWIARRCAT